jgi:hypothetical protein
MKQHATMDAQMDWEKCVEHPGYLPTPTLMDWLSNRLRSITCSTLTRQVRP